MVLFHLSSLSIGQFRRIGKTLLQQNRGIMVDYLAKYDYLEHPELPRLPVPELKNTLNKYLNTVECLLTKEEFEETKKVVENFSKGKGPELDEELRELAKKAPTSWLAGFWDTMYLELRCPK
jgi:carnitine O-acetyltransferase